jgi:hypothetical protein
MTSTPTPNSADGPVRERIERPTPNGGVASEAFYMDAKGNPTPKNRATAMEIHEYDAEGNSIFRTYMCLKTPEDSLSQE